MKFVVLLLDDFDVLRVKSELFWIRYSPLKERYLNISIIGNLNLVSGAIVKEHSDIVFSSINKLPNVFEFNAILSIKNIFNFKGFPAVFSIFFDLDFQSVRLNNVDSIFFVVISSI